MSEYVVRYDSVAQTGPEVWDMRWLSIAAEVASWSKDPAKQIGAVAVDQDNREIAKGYNGFPSRLKDYEHLLADDGYRRAHMVHAEENLCNNAMLAGRSLKGATVYLYGLAPCQHCGLILVNAWIGRVVFCQVYDDPKWNANLEIIRPLLDRAGVAVTEVTKECLQDFRGMVR